MLKLYKMISGALHYHEAWVADGTISEHWGRVGERGNQREHGIADGQQEDAAMEEVLQEARSCGFESWDESNHVMVLVEYVVAGMGASEDLEKRHALEERMNELLGWTGLGHCDGGSIGSGTMEVACVVVDANIAVTTIENDLKDTRFGDYSRIFIE